MKTSMKTWAVVAAGAILLLSPLFCLTGCGGGGSEKIDASQYDLKQPPGHEQALKEMEEKPQ